MEYKKGKTMDTDRKAAEERMTMLPVGHVENDLVKIAFNPENEDDTDARKAFLRENRDKIRETVSVVRIFDEYGEMLEGIEAFSHIVVLYWPHLLSEKRKPPSKIHPMGCKDIPLQGIFATRSPARPNPVLISVVELLARNDLCLTVKGLEALNGSPVIDIKPFVRHYDEMRNARIPDWLRSTD